MNKKKLISIVISAILSIIAAVLGCVYGIDVDFSGVDVGDTPTVSICSAMTHGQP